MTLEHPNFNNMHDVNLYLELMHKDFNNEFLSDTEKKFIKTMYHMEEESFNNDDLE